jgi:hypothetical protein
LKQKELATNTHRLDYEKRWQNNTVLALLLLVIGRVQEAKFCQGFRGRSERNKNAGGK